MMTFESLAPLNPAPATNPDVSPRIQAQRVLQSEALLSGRREVLINHGGEIYSLRHTRNGKLILTK